MTLISDSALNRSGLARISDLAAMECVNAMRKLERDQNAFIAMHPKILSAEYKWPRDPLHTWSRQWEYPYVYHHISRWREQSPSAPRIIDIGSGVTFFPFSVARLGCDVLCLDNDPVVDQDMRKAINIVPAAPGKVEMRLIDGLPYPIESEHADCVYCISVLEHIPFFVPIIQEISRMLRPNGLFILTIDIALGGINAQLDVSPYKDLMAELTKYFTTTHPHTAIHPKEMLTNFHPSSCWRERVRPLLYRIYEQVGIPRGGHLTCEGFVLIKR